MEHSCLIKSGYRLVSLPRLQHILRKSRGTSDYKMFSCNVSHFWVINQFFCQFQLSLFSFQRQINKGKVLLSVLTEGSPIMGDTEKIKVWKRAPHSILLLSLSTLCLICFFFSVWLWEMVLWGKHVSSYLTQPTSFLRNTSQRWSPQTSDFIEITYSMLLQIFLKLLYTCCTLPSFPHQILDFQTSF